MTHLDDYAPAVPSPLNPTTTPPPPPQRTNRTRCADDLIFLAAPFRRNTEVSPAEMLLRRKAAEAWRSHRLHARVAEYEMRTVRAITAKRVRTTGGIEVVISPSSLRYLCSPCLSMFPAS